MFHRVIAVFILCALLSTNFTRFFVYAGFEINKKYIAEKLCVNRLRPWMHCNGRCYFMKKIKQAEENDKKQEAKNNLNRLEGFFFQKPFQLVLIEPQIIAVVKNSFPAYNYQYRSRHLTTIFRPPKQIA